ncbi:MAG: tetratricopeptide repeat protein [Polyangiaceae bacterium]
MSRVVDLHPEALLDRAARGELTPAEATRLETHLARCPACRFERDVRADFAEELASDTTPSERLALAGLSHADPEPEIASPREELAPPSLRTRRSAPRRVTRATWLLVAAAVFAVTAAGATGVGQRAWSRLIGPPAPESLPATESAPTHVAAKRSPHHRIAPAPTALSREESAPDVLAAPLPEVVPAAPPPIVRREVARASAPSVLFDEATEARRQGSYARAIDLQRELLSRYPRSREAHVARETMGRLLLDRGDPAGAFASFDAYLGEGSGELGEEAMIGRATALERLGRTVQAADAWRALLAAYPQTPYAAHAQSRLGSLSVR